MRGFLTATIVTLSVWLPQVARPALGEEAPARFTRLAPLPAPAITGHTTVYPEGKRYVAAHLADGKLDTEYAADGNDSHVFTEFDFGRPVRMNAFRHVDRLDPATVASSELIFSDAGGKEIAKLPVAHVNQPGGTTFLKFPAAVTAQHVRWQVTGLGPQGYRTVGGREITFFAAEAPVADVGLVKIEPTMLPLLERHGDTPLQAMKIAIDYPYAEPLDATLRVEGLEPRRLRLTFGTQTIDALAPVGETGGVVRVMLDALNHSISKIDVPVKPVRKLTLYILPHSHVDIGYTQIQTDVENKQMANLAKGIELARATADYPEGARYRWNTEVLWAVESYLTKQPPEKQREFIEAVKKGWVELHGMYGNELTGLCRPEELLRLFRYGTELGRRCGVKVESAMISDVPGYTWGTVSAMAQAGIRYWSIGPNYGDRIGYTRVKFENKPFWWVGPNGKDRVLCWISYMGYAWSHILRQPPTPAAMTELMNALDKVEYPYDMVYIRWSGYGDNAVPDEKIPDFVKTWNERYVSPRVVISTVTEAFQDMERRYGDKLPTYTGDWTPYWEDGAGSSAQETAINRNSADRLVQAETLWALLNPGPFPAADFDAAWRNVMLYSEHTWGAYNSISEPDNDFVKEQWKIKQAFALDGQKQSLQLLAQTATRAEKVTRGVDIYNTTSWPRTGLAIVPQELDDVVGATGQKGNAQRLSTGMLAVLARDVPPLGGKRLEFSSSPAAPAAVAHGAVLENGLLSIKLDKTTGDIVELKAKGHHENLLDPGSVAANEFFFVKGTDSAHALPAGPAKITVKENGPLVASLLVESDAPGCNKLTREIRLTAGQDYVEIINTVDKKRIEDAAHAKEGLHFGYAFNVPNGVMRMDIPWAVMRPEADQLPGACKNWFTVGRWVDVSNDEYGVTWVTLDAPLVEVGGLTANLIGSHSKADDWMAKLEPSQTFYSWVMNNHWHTNYRAYQEGPTVFRYAIRPHRGFKPDEAARFATGLSQPLIALPAGDKSSAESRLRVEGDGVLVTAFKPSDDGKAQIIRLFNSRSAPAKAALNWADPKPTKIWLSDTGEQPIKELGGAIDLPAWGIVTVRIEN